VVGLKPPRGTVSARSDIIAIDDTPTRVQRHALSAGICTLDVTARRECSDTRSARALAHSTTDLRNRIVRPEINKRRPRDQRDGLGDFDRADTRGIEDRQGTLRRGSATQPRHMPVAGAIYVPEPKT
jgi:hypothetical protein